MSDGRHAKRRAPVETLSRPLVGSCLLSVSTTVTPMGLTPFSGHVDLASNGYCAIRSARRSPQSSNSWQAERAASPRGHWPCSGSVPYKTLEAFVPFPTKDASFGSWGRRILALTWSRIGRPFALVIDILTNLRGKADVLSCKSAQLESTWSTCTFTQRGTA